MKRNKSGISLIVLVITIIVMIILAAAVVITLDNSGIINKANEAVDENNLKQVQHLASLIWADAYLEGINIDKAYIEKELEDSGVDTDKYDIKVTSNGVTVTEKVPLPEVPKEWETSVSLITADYAPIPKGFVKSPYEGEGTVNEGLVIYALTETEIANGVTEIPSTETHQQSLENRNQFVWIPVNAEDVTIAETDSAEKKLVFESAKKYGGFYIGRYEANSTANKQVTMGKEPSRGATSDSCMAVAQAIYPVTDTSNNYGAVSTLMYDQQRALALAWFESHEGDFVYYGNYDKITCVANDFNANSKYLATARTYEVSGYGIFLDYSGSWTDITSSTTRDNTIDPWLLTTGALKRSNIYNTYDMYGNLAEVGVEKAVYMSDRFTDVAHGCSFNTQMSYGGTDIYAKFRANETDPANNGSYYYYFYGYRIALYIK